MLTEALYAGPCSYIGNYRHSMIASYTSPGQVDDGDCGSGIHFLISPSYHHFSVNHILGVQDVTHSLTNPTGKPLERPISSNHARSNAELDYTGYLTVSALLPFHFSLASGSRRPIPQFSYIDCTSPTSRHPLYL